MSKPMTKTNTDTRAWAALLTAHATLVERVEARLAAAELPPLAWYDVLWELEQAESGRLRMHELAARVVLSRSNLTRLADRLENAGLIAREACPDDRRGAFCVLTRSGRDTRRKMWPVYARAIDELFNRHTSAVERDSMVAGLRRAMEANEQGDT
jgi:DNA-binding MarR family transcriptional regulator